MASYYWYFDSTKARDELGFQARDAADTLHDTVTYLRQHILGRKPLVGRGRGAGPARSMSRIPTFGSGVRPSEPQAAATAGQHLERRRQPPRRLTVELDGDFGRTLDRHDLDLPALDGSHLLQGQVGAGVQVADLGGHLELVKSPTTTRSSSPSSRLLVGTDLHAAAEVAAVAHGPQQQRAPLQRASVDRGCCTSMLS